MAVAKISSATLRIFGDDLNPEEITKLLSCEPSQSQTKGQTFTSKSGRTRTAKTGLWRLSAGDREPENLDAQVIEIFQQLPDDLNIWEQLATNYDLDISCGLFLGKSNSVVLLAPETMQIFSSKAVRLTLDIYPGED